MSISKPPVKNFWANAAASEDVIEPSDAIKDAGMTPASKAIPRQWFNWLCKQATSVGAYLMARGIPDHDGGESYTVGDVVQAVSDGSVWRCKQACAGTQAVAENAYWEHFGANWLADALKTSLAASLPALMLTAMKTLLGIGATVGDITGGCFDCGGLRVGWVTGALDKSGGNVTTSIFTWHDPFGDIFTAVATPEGSDIQVHISAFDAATVTLVPFGQSANCTLFVLAIGTTPTA
jgi:hypothetical protein